MTEMVDARRSADIKEERRDLFSGLLDAADDDPDGSVAITDRELISTFRFPHRVVLNEESSTSLPQAICSSSSSLDIRYSDATHSAIGTI